jgi:pilus assembly protein CpaE
MTHAGLRRLTRVHRAFPRAVILVAPNGHSSSLSLQETAAVGVNDVLPYPSTTGRLRAKLRIALDTAEQLQAERIVVRHAAPPPPAQTRVNHVMTVTSATGGCGKTFYATNMAAYLAKATGKSVLLVDLDLQFGEVAVSLRLRPERTVAELVEEPDLAAAFADHIVSHEAGYDVLCAPKDPVSAERVGPREASAVLDVARGRYDYVVVDTPPAMNEVVLAAFDVSHSLIVMATMDVPSLKNMRVFLQTLDRLKISTKDVSIILNKAERGTGIDLPKVERLYEQGFSAVLPYAPEVTKSINVGQPVILIDPGAEISRKFYAGATALIPPAPGAVLPWNGHRERGGRLAELIRTLLRKGA